MIAYKNLRPAYSRKTQASPGAIAERFCGRIKHIQHSLGQSLRLALFLVTLCHLGLMVCVEVPSVAAASMLHTFKFYLDPELASDMDFVKTALSEYIADMNMILAKNTNRQFAFNPDTDISLTSVQPYSGSAGALPTTGYEIWAHVTPSDLSVSYGGIISFDESGAAALGDLRWVQLYDPRLLADGSAELSDYWTQIHHMLHEIAHMYGVGIGEYYNLRRVDDTTAFTPVVNIRFNDPNDAYWSEHSDFFPDPLLQNLYNLPEFNYPDSRVALLADTRFASLTAAIMRGDYRWPTVRPPLPDLDAITVTVRDRATLLPVPNAEVHIWNVQSVPPYLSDFLVDAWTTGEGEITFAWGGNGSTHSNFNHLRLSRRQRKAEGSSIKDAFVNK